MDCGQTPEAGTLAGVLAERIRSGHMLTEASSKELEQLFLYANEKGFYELQMALMEMHKKNMV